MFILSLSFAYVYMPLSSVLEMQGPKIFFHLSFVANLNVGMTCLEITRFMFFF
jgi:hypothetical protein